MATWTAHSGEDYTVVMRDDETTDTASIHVCGEDAPALAERIAAALNYGDLVVHGGRFDVDDILAQRKLDEQP